MRASPKPLDRPVVLLAGWRSPAFTPGSLARDLAGLTSGNPRDFSIIAYPWRGRFDRIVERVGSQLGRDFDGPVDIVAISMGGLVARALATDAGQKRIARLFTLATPHRGAVLARWIRPDNCARVMQPGSATLEQLDRALENRSYELVCYAQLRDWWVGVQTQSPVGMPALWSDVHSPLFAPVSHFTINRNPLITLDIARRLRGEPPLAKSADA